MAWQATSVEDNADKPMTLVGYYLSSHAGTTWALFYEKAVD